MSPSPLSLLLHALFGPFLPRLLAVAGGGGRVPGGDDVPTAIYRNLMDAVPQGAVVCSLDGEVLDANRRAAPLLGLEATVLEGLPLPTALEEAGCKPKGEPFQRLRDAAGKGQIATVGPVPLKEGLVLRLRSFRVGPQVLVLALLEGPGGAATPAGGMPIDSTSLEAFHEGALVLETGGKILAANAAAAHMTGKDREQLAGRPIAALIPAINPPGMAERLLSHTLSTGSWTGVLRGFRKGKEFRLGVTTRLTPRGHDPPRILVGLQDQGEGQGARVRGGLDYAPLLEAFAGLWEEMAQAPPARERILEVLGGPLDYDLACLEVYSEERGEFELALLDDRAGSRVRTGILLQGSGSTSGRVRETGVPLLLPDLSKERRWDDLRLFQDFRSGMKIGLPSGERFLGVLSLWSKQPAYFGEDHIAGGSILAALLVASDQLRELRRLRGEVEEEQRRGRMQGAALERIEEGILALDPEGRILWANRGAERLTGRDRDALQQAGLQDVVGRESGGELLDRLGRGAWRGKAAILRPEAAPRPVEAHLTGTAGDFARGTPLILVLRDRASQDSQDELFGALARQMETAQAMLDADLDAPDLAEFLARYARALQHLFPFQEAQIFLPSEEGEALVLHAAADGKKGRLERDLYFGREGTLLGEVAQQGEARVHPDLAEEHSADAVGFQEEGFRSAAMLPLPSSEGDGTPLHPLLVLLSTEPGAFRFEDLPVLGAFAGPVARALDRLGPAGRIFEGGAGT